MDEEEKRVQEYQKDFERSQHMFVRVNRENLRNVLDYVEKQGIDESIADDFRRLKSGVEQLKTTIKVDNVVYKKMMHIDEYTE